MESSLLGGQINSRIHKAFKALEWACPVQSSERDIRLILQKKRYIVFYIPFEPFHVLNSNAQSLRGIYQDTDLIRPRDTCINQAALQHDVVVHQDGHDYDVELPTLAFVDGHDVRQLQLVLL